MSDQTTILHKPYGNIKTDESTKVKRQCMKFFDSAEWAMKLTNTNQTLSGNPPMPSDNLIEIFKQKYENVENQSSPLTDADV